MKQILSLIILSNLVISVATVACPLNITNDNKNLNIIIVDHYNNQVVFIKAQSSATIDPTIYGWQKHFIKEKFDIFYQKKVNSSQYLHRYQVTENYCFDDPAKNQIKVSQFTKNSGTRFTIKETDYKKVKTKHHQENAHHH